MSATSNTIVLKQDVIQNGTRIFSQHTGGIAIDVVIGVLPGAKDCGGLLIQWADASDPRYRKLSLHQRDALTIMASGFPGGHDIHPEAAPELWDAMRALVGKAYVTEAGADNLTTLSGTVHMFTLYIGANLRQRS